MTIDLVGELLGLNDPPWEENYPDTQAMGPEPVQKIDPCVDALRKAGELLRQRAKANKPGVEACGNCRFHVDVIGSGFCRYNPVAVRKERRHWCGQFKRGKEGSKE